MLSLLIKDFLIQKKTVFFGFIYLIILIYAFQSMENALLSICITAFTYILIVTACAHDEKNNADTMLNSLPLKRDHIVFARYLSMYVFAFLGIVGYGIITNFIKMINLPIDVYPITYGGLLGALGAVTLMNSIYFPVYFKVGYMKSRILNLIMFFGLFFGLANLLNFLKSNQQNPFIYKTMELFMSLSDNQIAFLLVAVFLIILLISLTLSIIFYRNREF